MVIARRAGPSKSFQFILMRLLLEKVPDVKIPGEVRWITGLFELAVLVSTFPAKSSALNAMLFVTESARITVESG